MARRIQQVRTHLDTGNLDGAPYAASLTPGTIPDGSTITRTIGAIDLFARPAAGATSERILYRIGFGVSPDAAPLDVLDPNATPDAWLWWSGPLVEMRTQWVSDSATRLVPGSLHLEFDVHGQRVIVPSTGQELKARVQVVAAAAGGLYDMRYTLTTFYKLP